MTEYNEKFLWLAHQKEVLSRYHVVDNFVSIMKEKRLLFSKLDTLL